MFENCTRFDCDLSKWDIRNIRNMRDNINQFYKNYGKIKLGICKNFNSYERESPPTGESPRPSEMENEIDFRFQFP